MRRILSGNVSRAFQIPAQDMLLQVVETMCRPIPKKAQFALAKEMMRARFFSSPQAHLRKKPQRPLGLGNETHGVKGLPTLNPNVAQTEPNGKKSFLKHPPHEP
ncbi:hypothetical protein SLA2020_027070 [Shorea laevis]